jgi:nucleotide-binding universal stress UspA family protein
MSGRFSVISTGSATAVRPPARIVVGVDGSDSSIAALALTRGLAQRVDASVTVVYVRHRLPLMAVDVPVDCDRMFAGTEEAVRNAAEQWLVGLDWVLVVTDGLVAQELERIAADVNAGVLVLGRSRGGLIRHLVEGSGSVGIHAVHKAAVPVLIAR